MSCYVTISTRITDIELLAASLEGLSYRVTRRPVADRRGDVVLSVTGEEEGKALHFDVVGWTGREVELRGDNQILSRKRTDAIHRAYAERLVVRRAEEQGFSGIERREVEGEVVLTLRKWVA